MLSILFKALLIYILFRVAKGIYNGYRLSKKIRSSWEQSARKNSGEETFEAQYRHLDDD